MKLVLESVNTFCVDEKIVKSIGNIQVNRFIFNLISHKLTTLKLFLIILDKVIYLTFPAGTIILF